MRLPIEANYETVLVKAESRAKAISQVRVSDGLNRQYKLLMEILFKRKTEAYMNIVIFINVVKTLGVITKWIFTHYCILQEK